MVLRRDHWSLFLLWPGPICLTKSGQTLCWSSEKNRWKIAPVKSLQRPAPMPTPLAFLKRKWSFCWLHPLLYRPVRVPRVRTLSSIMLLGKGRYACAHCVRMFGTSACLPLGILYNLSIRETKVKLLPEIFFLSSPAGILFVSSLLCLL